jgi:hypothetical protein
MRDILGAVPTFAAASSFAVLILALTHEWSFFLVVGPQFQSLMSSVDYLNSAIGWIPAFVIAWFVMLVIDLSVRRLTGISPFSLGSFTQVLLFAGGLIELLFGNPYSSESIGLIFGWSWLCFWLYRHEYISSRLSMAAFIWILFIPPVWGLAFLTGRTAGYFAVNGFSDVYIVKTKSDNDEKHYILLRNLSRGLLVRDPIASRIDFIKWEDITSFASKIPVLDTAPRVCNWFGFRCPLSPPLP